MPNVSFIRPELRKLLPQYYLIRDCLEGEVTIKDKGRTYLPKPNEADKSEENEQRYIAYKKRAVFYNVTRHTLSGYVGQVFMRDPVIELPDLMEAIKADATGSGVNLVQLAKKSQQMTLAYSRSGLFVDFPTSNPEMPVTKKDIMDGTVRPTITAFSPMQIVNWRTREVGGKELLSLVVIQESYCSQDDGFEMKNSHQYRVLRLDESNNYIQEIYREEVPSDTETNEVLRGDYILHDTFSVTDGTGAPLKFIPFIFIGCDNNDPYPDNPNMYDLSSLNVAHYRNSADYEEACFITGQPTLILSGLTENWVTGVLKNKVTLGSHGYVPMPKNSDAKLLQASPNTMIKEAMEIKERQMVALGAKLAEQKTVQRTATEARIETAETTSVLASSAKNVSQAYLWALKVAASFINADSDKINFELNSDFEITKMSPQERAQVIAEWQSGAITFEEMRKSLKKAGSAYLDDKEAKQEINNEMVDAMGSASQQNESLNNG